LIFCALTLSAMVGINVLCQRSAVGELVIQFDYSLDTQGFFSDPVRRDRMEQAAAMFRFADVLAPISPGGANQWSVRLTHPGEPSFPTRTNLAVPADTVLIFPGGRPLAGALGFANAGTVLSRSGSPEFLAAVDTRGQIGAAQTPPIDFGPTVGTITFSSLVPRHFGETTAGLDNTKQDFLTTAVHEIGHLLGVGESPSWDAQVRSTGSGLVFDGPAPIAAHGGPVPLDQFASHFALGVSSTVNGVAQQTLMDPSTPRGVRELPTVLDYAALADIGWTTAAVPEPGSIALLGVAAIVMASVRVRARCRKAIRTL
jgi:hypothetical protein